MELNVYEMERLDVLVKHVFSARFEISKNQKIGAVKCAYVMENSDRVGRTLTGTDKAIDVYDTYQNCYVICRDITVKTLKTEVDAIYQSLKPTLKLNHTHYATTLNLIFMTTLDDELVKVIQKYHRTQLLALGFKGHIEVNVIGLDVRNRLVAGGSSVQELVNCLKGELLK